MSVHNDTLEPAVFTLRLPGPLLDQAVRAARAQGEAERRYVSLTNWVNQAIREKLAREKSA